MCPCLASASIWRTVRQGLAYGASVVVGGALAGVLLGAPAVAGLLHVMGAR